MASPNGHSATPSATLDQPFSMPISTPQDSPVRAERPDRPDTSDTRASSEYESANVTHRQSAVPSRTGPVGEPGLPPSRSISPSQSRSSSNRPISVAIPLGSTRALATVVGSTRALGGTAHSRPESPATNQTHVPTLTSHAFFRPMSSQMLQQQRAQQSSNPLQQGSVANRPSSDTFRTETDGSTSKTDRTDRAAPKARSRQPSNASIRTVREGTATTLEDDIPPVPPSRGAITPTPTYDIEAENKTDGGYTVASGVSRSSSAPLQPAAGAGQQPATRIMTGAPTSVENKSSRTLRTSLGLGPRSAGIDKETRPGFEEGHQRLASDESSSHRYPEKPLPPDPEPLPIGKNYEYYVGNANFFCGGRLLNTRSAPLNTVTFFLTFIPGILFFAFSAPYLWNNISPALPVLFAYIWYISISSFLHAAFSDPGILPRNIHPLPPNPTEEADPLAPGPKTTEWVMVKTFYTPKSLRTPPTSNDPEGQQASPQAMEVPTKYCKSCNIWRPPRAHHCRVCDACIETQDHHCVWLNNCVGRRNYRFFFAYVGSATLLALLLASFSLTHIICKGAEPGVGGFGGALSHGPPERGALAMFVYSLLALPYPGSLFMYHLFLMSRGETTREYLNSHKFPLKDRHRPFTLQSAWRNWFVVLVRPRAASYMQFSRPHSPGDRRHGHDRRKSDRRKAMTQRFSVPAPASKTPDPAAPSKDRKKMKKKQKQKQKQKKQKQTPDPTPPPPALEMQPLPQHPSTDPAPEIASAPPDAPTILPVRPPSQTRDSPPRRGPGGPTGILNRTPR